MAWCRWSLPSHQVDRIPVDLATKHDARKLFGLDLSVDVQDHSGLDPRNQAHGTDQARMQVAPADRDLLYPMFAPLVVPELGASGADVEADVLAGVGQPA